jgi:hypothetical protein
VIGSEFLGTLPGWLTSAGVLTMVGLLLRWQVLNRQIGQGDTINIRDHYAKEVGSLRSSLHAQAARFRDDLDAMDKRYREILASAEERHEECLADRDKLRQEVGILRDEINGLVRVITQASIDRVVMLGDVVPIEIKEAAERAQDYINKENARGGS